MLPSKQFITLSEAISWIAFGDPQDGSSLQRALRDPGFGNRPGNEAKLTQAIRQLTELATGNLIELRGKHVSYSGADERQIDTRTIAATELADFAMFNAYEDGLHRGRGLLWTGHDRNGEQLANTVPEDYFRCVTVRRDDLERHFTRGGKLKARPGRKLGTGSSAADDEALFPEIESLLSERKARSVNAAALQLAFDGRIAGNGIPENKAQRLAKRFRASRSSSSD